MTHREVANRVLMLMKPESLGVISGTGQWNTEEMLKKTGSGGALEHENDNLWFRITIAGKPPTQRGTLSITSSVFDPLGIVSFAVLPVKVILQDLCRRKLVSSEVREHWFRWLKDLPKL